MTSFLQRAVLGFWFGVFLVNISPIQSTQLKLMLHSPGHFELDVDQQLPPNFPPLDEEITWEELQKTVATYHHFFDGIWNESSKVSFQGPVGLKNLNCACKDLYCACCYQLSFEKLHISVSACVNISYIPDEFAINVAITLNRKNLISKKISVKTPEIICVEVPFIGRFAKLCLSFNNMHYSHTSLKGCAGLEAKVLGVTLKKFNLGCFEMP
ncbi:hypothetical protein BgiMline_014600 [Biomphalaria glabrata]|nr:papilin-like [Biomphalaria glabrata]